MVIDPRTVQPLQTLAHHKSNIIRVATAHCTTPLAAAIRPTFGGACSLTLCLTKFCVPTTATIDTGYSVPICTLFSPSPLSLSLQLRWSHHRQHHTLASPYSLRLASVDTSSLCVVWDVGQAAVLTEFSLGNKPLVDMQWLTTDVSRQTGLSCSCLILKRGNASQFRTQVRSCWL